MNYFLVMIAYFLLPLVMIICGMTYTKKPPKRITKLSGYRSKMSMKNRDTWEFAHWYIGDLWFKVGVPLLAVSSVVALIVFRQQDDAILLWCYVIVALQLVLMLLPIRYTERAMKRFFDENGKWQKGMKDQFEAMKAKRIAANNKEK